MSTEQTLAGVLHEQAEAASYDATPMSVVAGRARGIRRRRRATTAGVVAAVAAAVVPLAVLLPGGDGGRGVAPVDAPDAPPRIGYAVDGVYHRADGSTIDLPDGEITTVTEHEGGVIVSDDPGVDGPLRLTSVAGSGEVLDTWCATSVPVTDGEAVAWTEVSCAGGAATIVVDRPDAEPESWTVPGEPVLAGIRPVGGVVYVDAADDGAPYVSDREGFRARVPGLDRVFAYAPATDRVAGATGDRAVVATVTGEVVARWGDPAQAVFSPDGARLFTSSGRWLRVLDADSGRLLSRTAATDQDGRYRFGVVRWEDRTHLLLVDAELMDVGLVRIGPDGAVTPLPEPAASSTGIVLQTVP